MFYVKNLQNVVKHFSTLANGSQYACGLSIISVSTNKSLTFFSVTPVQLLARIEWTYTTKHINIQIFTGVEVII